MHREITRYDGLVILDKMKQVAEMNDVLAEAVLMEANDAKKVSENLIESVKIYQADLLIVGTHGRYGFNRLIDESQG